MKIGQTIVLGEVINEDDVEKLEDIKENSEESSEGKKAVTKLDTAWIKESGLA